MRHLLIAACAAVTITSAAADTYPSRSITVIVPFPPGGPVDTLARLLIDPMRASLGQPLIVENVTGAGGGIAVARVALQRPMATPSSSAIGRASSGRLRSIPTSPTS